MALSSSALLPIAKMMALAPHEAIALPTTIEVASRKAGMSQDRLFHECLSNVALRDYLAGICRNAMAEVAA